jgi:16S rRNA (guanine527-N7)-methyltransferase
VKHDPLRQFLELVAQSPQRLVADTSDAALAAHVADAETALPLMADETGPLIDVGSGAGFPGVPLLLARADLDGTLLESRAKRCAHLAAVIDATGLGGRAIAVLERAETYARGTGRDHFGICVARALAPPPVALELCLPLVRPGGLFILHAGAIDRSALEGTARLLEAEVEQVVPTPGFAQRQHVTVRKLGPTPLTFPRRIGVAAKDPLVRPTG